MSTKEWPLARELANKVTDARPRMVAGICEDILAAGPDFRSVRKAGRLAMALSSDGIDGMLARFSNIPDSEYARKDRDFDKWCVYMLYSTLAIATGDERYGLYLGVNLVRDARADATREVLDGYGFKTDARDLGKHKFRLQSLGLILDVSPVGDMAPDMVHGIHMTASGLAIVSGLDIEWDARRKLQATSALPDTTPELV